MLNKSEVRKMCVFNR